MDPEMDPRDSSAASNSAADEEAALLSSKAKEAAQLFNSRMFSDCLDILYQLAQKRTADPKILHNIAITEFFRDGCSNPRRLIDVLTNVKQQSEGLAHASLEHVEAANSASDEDSAGSNGNDSAPEHQVSAANNTSTFYGDEIDHPVAILNIAIIWFHLSEYTKALSILEPLYSKIEPIDETIALHICLLLLDVALASNDIAKSADVLNYLEKPLDSGSTVQQQSPNLVAKLSSVSNNSAVADNSDIGNSAGVNPSDKSGARTLFDETFEYESMVSEMDIGGPNLGSSKALSSSNFSSSALNKSIPSVDLKLNLQLYKVRFLLLSGNLKAAKREVKGAMNACEDSTTAILLKSQLEYARGNYRKAIKLLMALENRTGGAIASMFFNNLGCIYHELGKVHCASIVFTKSLTSSLSLRKEKPLKLSNFSQDKSLFISYNCGVQYLACGKPVLAARCLLKAQTAFYNKPLFWFRLAECCLVASEMGLIKNGEAHSERSELKLYVVGKGKWRRLAIKDGSFRNGLSHSAEKIDWSLSNNDGQPELSLSLARLCLYNALHILSSCGSGLESAMASPLDSVDVNDLSEASRSLNHRILQGVEAKLSAMNLGAGQVTSNGDPKEQKAAVSQELISSSLSIYKETSRKKNKIIMEAVLANLAYVEMELENPQAALSCARSLLQRPDCSRIYAFLGHMYAAEALCLLNRADEANEHLSVYIAEGKNIRLPFTEEDLRQWQVVKNSECDESNNGGGPVSSNMPRSEDLQIISFLKPEEARAVLYVNLAARFAMNGELQKALELVNQALIISANSREALLTSVYIHIALGNTREALTKLKQLTRVRFLPFSATSKSL